MTDEIPVLVDEPDVLFDPDLIRILRTSTSTWKRLRRVGRIPVPTLPSIDGRRRYAKRDLVLYLRRETSQSRGRR